jgi:rRNA-processing protein FCF1
MERERDSPNTRLRVILDSNALFVPLQFKIDIFQGLKTLLNRNYESILLSPVLAEIERLARESSPEVRKNACFALTLTSRCKLVRVEESSGTSTDEIIAKTAQGWNCPVFTNDRQLRKRLRNINVPVIYVRQKARLAIDGRITLCSSL